jgi:hypothetical protein
MDQVLQKRSGVTQTSQGLDANILQNTTATAIAAMQQAGSGRLEMIARIFADTGVKDLFSGIFHLLCKYQDKERVIRLRGKYVSVDPRNWKTNYDLSINVGLGTGNKDQQMAMAAMVLQKQEQILGTQGYSNPLVTVGQYRSTLGRFIEAAGYKDSNEFFKEISPELDAQISQPPPPQQAPIDPAVQAYMAQTQAQIQGDQAKIQAQIQGDQVKAQADIQLAREKAAAEIQLARDKAAAQLELKAAEFEAENRFKTAELMAKGMGA